MTLVTTPGASTANSLASLVEAEDYMGMVIFKDDWTAAADALKESALRQASELMDQLPWKGVTVTAAQALCWPRWDTVSGLYDKNGFFVPSDSIPKCVRNACCEFAFRLISDDRQADAGGLAPTELKSGTTTITNLQRRPIPPSVIEKVRQFLTSDGSSIKLVRGS